MNYSYYLSQIVRFCGSSSPGDGNGLMPELMLELWRRWPGRCGERIGEMSESRFAFRGAELSPGYVPKAAVSEIDEMGWAFGEREAVGGDE